MAKILILEDHIEIISTLKDILEEENHQVESETDPQKVISKVESFQPDIVTLDISFSEERDEQGIGLLEQIRKNYPTNKELPVIVISGTGDSNKLTRLYKLGIQKPYIHKPFEADQILQAVQSALHNSQEQNNILEWKPSLEGESKEIMDMISEIDRCATAQCDILITGETGSGKELVAKKYRELSPRADKPFKIINCPTIPTELFEAEVYGYVKGAFDGATSDRAGMVEEADGGIVFFDEFGELPLKHQVKLLRFFSSKTFQRIGENKERKLDVVILAATNRDLYKMVKDSQFREDLYYRLKTNRIHVATLKERLSDLPVLVKHFMDKYNHYYNKHISGIDTEAIKQLKAKSWQGNVRQLEQCIGYGMLRSDQSQLYWSDLEGYFQEETEKAKRAAIDENWNYAELMGYLDNYSKKLQKEHVLTHLKKHHFNVTETAKSLKFKQRTQMYELMKKLDIELKKEK